MLLRMTQHELEAGRHRVALEWEGEGARRKGEATFSFQLTDQDEEDLRWYLEDYLQYPQDPAPTIAQRVEGRMVALGEELFKAVFQASDETRDLWAEVRRHLPAARVEIDTSVAAGTTLPWELLRDPRLVAPVALAVRSFVRCQPRTATPPQVLSGVDGPVRILVVICRPGGRADVPFRSVASRLLKGLGESARAVCDLHVLRPPTFEQLGRALRQAKEEGRPYHAVHFDGHGTYRDAEELAGWSPPSVVMAGRTGQHGYLAFENPALPNNMELVDGPQLGRVLAEVGLPVLVLNACRSAHAEPDVQPAVAGELSSEVRAFGSLAQEVMAAGVGGVVAMRYNVYVVTAAQMVAELYVSLARGRTLGEAVTLARKNLADRPLREITAGPRPLQDWPVPVVYEAAPLRLFPEAQEGGKLDIKIEAGAAAEAGGVDSAVPPAPDAGFWGRDETLLALDRAFDRDQVVLLHAYAGSGKTTTAAEFARWYARTGGVDGPVLWSSFEHHLPLARLLDRFGQVFGPLLEKAGVHWLAIVDESQRRSVALQVLSQIPVLWVWDNVEPVAGFPAGTPSAWSEAEQAELADFLRALKGTKAKMLLTSRRDEHAWLGDLPTRVAVPPMPLLERLQLARALAEKHGRRLTEVEDWRPLLQFTDGNPLALTVLVGQALREGLKTKEQIEAFVHKLRAGEGAFADEAGEGRSRSLGASLAYGFESAFSEEERRRLALLSLFQGFVDVGVLRWMGNTEEPWCLAEVRGMGREAWIALLDRAAEVGLLAAHGDGYYGIHPALPWFFRGLFEASFPEGGVAATRAYVETMGGVGDYYWRQYQDGNRDVIGALGAEEANLLHAHRLARAHGWWGPVTSAMQGLRMLYEHTGRRGEWSRLVEEIVPDFVDPASDGPVGGREKQWGLVMDYRVLLAREERQWAEAERLQTFMVEWDRRRAAGAMAVPASELDGEKKTAIRNLAGSLHELGQIRRELGRVDCVPAYEESLELSERIGERAGAAIVAFNLGNAYKDLTTLRDLEQAERWYERSLELQDKRDRLGRGKYLNQLGAVALERFLEAQAGGRPEEELLALLNEAVQRYQEALELLPPDAVGDLAVTHNDLGVTYRNAGDVDRALPHYRRAIELGETQGDLYGAAQRRFNVAIALLDAGRREDAMEYAEAALRGFESFGGRAEDLVERTQRLIEEIRQA